VTIDFEDDVRLLRNARFRRLLESRLVGQTAQNALLYSLLILLVKHTLAGDEGEANFLPSHEGAADFLRACGGDPRILDPIPDADPQPSTP